MLATFPSMLLKLARLVYHTGRIHLHSLTEDTQGQTIRLLCVNDYRTTHTCPNVGPPNCHRLSVLLLTLRWCSFYIGAYIYEPAHYRGMSRFIEGHQIAKQACT